MRAKLPEATPAILGVAATRAIDTCDKADHRAIFSHGVVDLISHFADAQKQQSRAAVTGLAAAAA